MSITGVHEKICPFCSHEKTKLLEKIRSSDLDFFYKRLIGSSVSDEFGETDKFDFIECLNCGLKFFHPFVPGSGKFYEKLEKCRWYYPDDKQEFDYVRTFIDKESNVLEVGCGKGNFASTLNVIKYTGLELNESAVSEAQERGIDVRAEKIEVHAMDNAEKYDVVCSFQVLEHVEGIRNFIESSLKCLKKEGLYIVSVPNCDSFLKDQTNGILNMPPHHLSWWRVKTLKHLEKEFDVEIIEVHEEKIAKVHEKLFYLAQANIFLKRIFLRKNSIIERNIIKRILISALAKGISFLRNVEGEKGHTVTVVFRKK